MNDDFEFWAMIVGGFVLVMALSFGLAALIASVIGPASCDAQWRNSGLNSRWTLMGDCQVQLADGRWLPANRVREIDIKPSK